MGIESEAPLGMSNINSHMTNGKWNTSSISRFTDLRGDPIRGGTKIDSPLDQRYSPPRVKPMAQTNAPRQSSQANTHKSSLLGVDLGSNHIRVGTVDPTGRVLAFRREPYSEE